MSDGASFFAPASLDVGAGLTSIGGDLGATGLPSVIGSTATGLASDVGGGLSGPILTGVSDLAGGVTGALPAFSGGTNVVPSFGFNTGGGPSPLIVGATNAQPTPIITNAPTGTIGPTTGGAGAGAFASAAPPGIDPSQIAGSTSLPMTAGTGSGEGGMLSGLSDLMKKNPWITQLGIPAAGLGYLALSQKPLSSIPGYGANVQTADQLKAQGAQLSSYLTSGTLPPGVKESLNQASEAAKAAIRSRYAASGESGSSAEATDLANVDTTLVSQGAQIATNLLNTGVQESGLAANIYAQIMQTSIAQDSSLGTAFATLVGAAARPSITVGGTTP